MENQGYQHYRDQQGQNILEMNQNELLLALYDGLVKRWICAIRSAGSCTGCTIISVMR